MLVVAMYLGGFVLHAVAIWFLPLYLAQATISLSLPVTVLVSRRLSEWLTPRTGWVSAPSSSGSPRRRGSGRCRVREVRRAFAATRWAVW